MSTKIVCVALLVLTIGLTACGGKKKNEDIITQRVVEVQSNEPVRMQEYHAIVLRWTVNPVILFLW